MHLLQATPGTIEDGAQAVDLEQQPADIIVISAADSELASLAEARANMTAGAPSLRLAHLAHLAHPMSVDLYLDQTASRSRLVIARVLGGASYWPYGIEQFQQRLSAAGVPFAALPGDDKPDEGLLRVSTVAEADWRALWGYLVEGGQQNAIAFLRYANSLLEQAERPEPARPLLRAGVYWPGDPKPDLSALRRHWQPGRPVAAIVFYRALLQGAGLNPINRLIRQLIRDGLNPLPIFVASLREPVSVATVERLFTETPPAIVLNTTSFAVSTPSPAHAPTALDAPGCPVLQVVLAGSTEEAWEQGLRGLSARDIAMNVALPEIDGRILSRAVSFKGEAYFDQATQCRIATYRARGDRIAFVSRLAANWTTLAARPAGERRIALILANYPNKDGRLANGVGLDTPASAIIVLEALRDAGYRVDRAPATAAELMQRILAGPTNWRPDRAARVGGARLALSDYQAFYDTLPWALRRRIEARWGSPDADPFLADGGFALAVLEFGHVVLGVQPARGYDVDPTATYHSPDLVPPHHYLAFYAWLRLAFGADAIVHLGKHGNLEWLPGKALALSEACLPEAVLGPLPHLYPFIVNDPGEGTQAKRRTQAVIIDHLTPPLTRAETYGPLRELEALVDEYYEAAGIDPRRLGHLAREIMSLTRSTRLDEDAGIEIDEDQESALAKLDEYLCELKESQIRDGLHIFGRAPQGRLANDLVVALARLPRGQDAGKDASLIRSLAADLQMAGFDPLDCRMGEVWTGPRPAVLDAYPGAWRTNGDTVERLEWLVTELIDGRPPAPDWRRVGEVLREIDERIRPAVQQAGRAELAGLLRGLDGQFVPPGASGAPTRGRLDVLPTGRNFYSVDTRSVPTPAAWHLGWKSAALLVERYVQQHGDWPKRMALSAWGTSNMRTGGDDIAQALALIGARPIWDQASRRVTGFEILPASVMERPRVDVTLRISGFFRDAFPGLIELFASAVKAVMGLDEPEHLNPLAARYRDERDAMRGGGIDSDAANARAAVRIFGSKPGAYGAGLQAMIDERLWKTKHDLADAYLEWGSYAYGGGREGEADRDLLEARLGAVEAVIHNQDNREHDLLDSDDYYQFEGGLAATVEALRGEAPAVFHNDHSRPERPVIRTLEEEIGRVVRSRVVNPKWLDGVKRHGYKGAFEIAATVDYLFAFAATTHAVKAHHFDLVFDAVLGDEATRNFIAEANAPALKEIAERFAEAIDRGLWSPRSNSAQLVLQEIGTP